MDRSVAPMREPTEPYDLLVKGGRVLDPSQGLDRPMELAVSGGRVIGLAERIDASMATEVLDTSGLMVVPGLVDMHLHCYPGGTVMGVDADGYCLPRGTTTVVDAGSAGSSSFPGLAGWIANSSCCRVLAFVHLSCIGLAAVDRIPELGPAKLADPDGVLQLLDKHRGVALGIKIRLSSYAVGGHCAPYLKLGRELADAARCRLMVHIGDTVETLPEILSHLRPGDVVSHCFTSRPHGILDEQGRVLPPVLEAARAGVVFDSAHGRSHFSFGVAERALDQGFLPSTISTDLTTMSMRGPVVDLLTTMDKFLVLGMTLPEVLARVTSAPAAALGRIHEFGTLEPGAEADFALLDFEQGEFGLRDADGETREIPRRLRTVAVARRGQVIHHLDHQAPPAPGRGRPEEG